MRRLAAVMVLGAGVLPVARAQGGRGAGDWSTAGGDAQRSSWVRADAKISRESLQKPGFQLTWKLKLNNEALAPTAVLSSYIGYRGFRSLVFAGGSSDKVIAVDTDLGRIEWQKSLSSAAVPPGSPACPGGMTANVARPVTAAILPPPSGRGQAGRGTPAKSGAGEPLEGAVTLKEIAARAAAAASAPPPPARTGARAGPVPGRQPSYLYALSSDGMLHSMYVSNGDEPGPSVKFLPPNANAQGLTVIDNVAYVVTAAGCGGAPDAVWALDLSTKEVASWRPAAGGIAGSDGIAFGPDGTLYAATRSGDLASLESKTLKVKDVLKAGRELTSSPVVFQYKEQILIAAATKDGRIFVVDSAASGSPGYLSPVFVPGGDFAPGALATWQDPSGARFVLAAASNSVAAWKLVEQNGAPTFEPAWTSPGLVSPLTPFILNGVVFAASSGERSTPAVLYALDGSTGKSLWNSGKTIGSFTHSGGLSGGNSQVYLGTYDGTLYAFGFPIEH